MNRKPYKIPQALEILTEPRKDSELSIWRIVTPKMMLNSQIIPHPRKER